MLGLLAPQLLIVHLLHSISKPASLACHHNVQIFYFLIIIVALCFLIAGPRLLNRQLLTHHFKLGHNPSEH